MTQYKLSGSYREYLVGELRADPEFAVNYLREAFNSLGNPEERAVSMLAIRDVAHDLPPVDVPIRSGSPGSRLLDGYVG